VPWFSVRSNYRHIDAFLYEERVVLFEATGFDDAIAPGRGRGR